MGTIKRSERPELVEKKMSISAQKLFDLIWKFQGSKNEFLLMRQEALMNYDKLKEEEKIEVDESMIMEHLSMLYSCLVKD